MEKEVPKKNSHGGARQGSGRKPENRTKGITVWFKIKDIDALGGDETVKELLYKTVQDAVLEKAVNKRIAAEKKKERALAKRLQATERKKGRNLLA